MKWLLIALIVIPGTIADVLNAMGMKRNGEVCDFRPRAIFRLVASLARNPHVGVGVLALAVSFFALMALLSIANLVLRFRPSPGPFLGRLVFGVCELGLEVRPTSTWLVSRCT